MHGEGIASMGTGMWLFWILLIVIILLAVKAFAGGASAAPRSGRENPMEILKARYARGEIDDEEFNRRRRKLEE